jgi:hypothetical protein
MKRGAQKASEQGTKPNGLDDDSKYHKVSLYRRSGLNKLISEVLIPVLLFIAIPTLSIVLWYICAKFNGDLHRFALAMLDYGSLYEVVDEIIISRFYVTQFSALVICGFFAWSIVLTLLLPGEYYNGNITVNGNYPNYKDNGLSYHIVTTIAYFAMAYYLETIGYSVGVLYDRYDEILITLNIFGSVFCWFLYFKGKVVALKYLETKRITDFYFFRSVLSIHNR